MSSSRIGDQVRASGLDARRHERTAGRAGMSLLEIMVVISIIIVLASMVFSAVKMVTGAARRVSCQSNLRQLGMGLLGYSTDWQSHYPNWKWQDAINDYINEWREVGWNGAAGSAHGKTYTVAIARCKMAPLKERDVPLEVTYGMAGTVYGTYRSFVEQDLLGDANKALGYCTRLAQVVNPAQKALLVESWSWTSNQHHWGSNHVNNFNVRRMHGNSSNVLWADLRAGQVRVNGEFAVTTPLGNDPMWEPASKGTSAYTE